MRLPDPARIGFALVIFDFTVSPVPTWLTLARVTSND
eukprot:SAG31_NODE_45207_length_259_cov_1.618750_1_plen_36_part_10